MNKVLLEYGYVYLCIVICGCFGFVMVELSGCSRNCTVYKVWIVYYLGFCRK